MRAVAVEGTFLAVMSGAMIVAASSGGLGAPITTGVMDIPAQVVGPEQAPAPSVARADAVEAERVRRVEALLAAHECWSDDATAPTNGTVPSHAVVRWPGDKWPTYGGPTVVKAALGHVFEGRYPGMSVHGFCR